MHKKNWKHAFNSLDPSLCETLKYVDAIEGVVKGFSFKTVGVERLQKCIVNFAVVATERLLKGILDSKVAATERQLVVIINYKPVVKWYLTVILNYKTVAA